MSRMGMVIAIMVEGSMMGGRGMVMDARHGCGLITALCKSSRLYIYTEVLVEINHWRLNVVSRIIGCTWWSSKHCASRSISPLTKRLCYSSLPYFLSLAFLSLSSSSSW